MRWNANTQMCEDTRHIEPSIREDLETNNCQDNKIWNQEKQLCEEPTTPIKPININDTEIVEQIKKIFIILVQANGGPYDINSNLIKDNINKYIRKIQTSTTTTSQIKNNTLKDLFKPKTDHKEWFNQLFTNETEINFDYFKKFIINYTNTIITKQDIQVQESCEYIEDLVFKYDEYYKWLETLMEIITDIKTQKYESETIKTCLQDIIIDNKFENLKKIQEQIEQTKDKAKIENNCGDEFINEIKSHVKKWTEECITIEKTLLLQLSACILEQKATDKLKNKRASSLNKSTVAFNEHVKAGEKIREEIKKHKNDRFH